MNHATRVTRVDGIAILRALALHKRKRTLPPIVFTPRPAMFRLPCFKACLLSASAVLLLSFYDRCTAQDSVSYEVVTEIITDVAMRPTAPSVQSADLVAGAQRAESASPKPRKTKQQTLLIVQPDCPECDELLQRLEQTDFAAMRANGWKIGTQPSDQIRIVNKSEIEDLLQDPDAIQVPTAVGIENGEVVRYFSKGCSTPLDMWTFHWLHTGNSMRPTPEVTQPVTVPTTGNYPLRGRHWSVDGDWHPSRGKVLTHLRGVNHAHQLRTEWDIEVWTVEELRSLHDNLHEIEAYGRTLVQSSPLNAANYQPDAAHIVQSQTGNDFQGQSANAVRNYTNATPVSYGAPTRAYRSSTPSRAAGRSQRFGR